MSCGINDSTMAMKITASEPVLSHDAQADPQADHDHAEVDEPEHADGHRADVVHALLSNASAAATRVRSLSACSIETNVSIASPVWALASSFTVASPLGRPPGLPLTPFSNGRPRTRCFLTGVSVRSALVLIVLNPIARSMRSAIPAAELAGAKFNAISRCAAIAQQRVGSSCVFLLLLDLVKI
jgi:hypothetical protein